MLLTREEIKQRLVGCEQLSDEYHVDTKLNQQLMQKEQKEQAALMEYLALKGINHKDNFSPAAVMIPLVERQTSAGNQWHILLTQRAAHLKHHPGEISFPGGRQEASDRNLIQTALRECHEEIGINPNGVEILGRLPRQKTISQYHVTPYVAVIPSDAVFKLDHNEVESLFEIPLHYALDKTNQQQISQQVNGRTFHFYVIQYQQHRIWGATARMLVNLSYRLNPGI